ncbi:MAG: glyceraldehyde-3-phosphate dehydrogenase, partial [Flavobacteriales bacterium]
MEKDTVKVANENNYEEKLGDWVDKEKKAISIINNVGHLLYENSVELVFFRNPLVDRSISEILSLFQYAEDVVQKPIRIEYSAEIAKNLVNLDLAPSKVDLGKLTYEWEKEKDNFNEDISTFLDHKLSNFKGNGKEDFQPRDVILYGFGRIGRLCARELIQQAGSGHQLRLKAIVTRTCTEKDIVKRAALLRMDSVHGPFPGTVKEDPDNSSLIINGQIVKMIGADSPNELDYTQHNINNALVIDNSGAFRTREKLGLHLKAKGVSKALLTAPGKEDIPNIVFGINHECFGRDNEDLFSAASCTTNAIVPILKVVKDNFGIESGHMETIHAYTNDQNLLDNMHKKNRRGRSAAINMVLTETGAANAVTKIYPELEGKLSANAVRVPTPDGSLAILNLRISRETSREEVNQAFKNEALEGE